MQPDPHNPAAGSRTHTTWALLLIALLAPGVAAGQPRFTEGKAEACLECHNERAVMGILETPHARASDPRSPAAQRECESCHGASAAHAHAPIRSSPMRYGPDSNAPEERRNAACQHCHEDDAGADWATSPHAASSRRPDPLSCARCHSLHPPSDPALSARGRVGQCLECHPGVLGRSWIDPDHRVDRSGGGKMTCTTCHDPHARNTDARCMVCHPQDPEALAAQALKPRSFHRAAKREHKLRNCVACHAEVAHQQ